MFSLMIYLGLLAFAILVAYLLIRPKYKEIITQPKINQKLLAAFRLNSNKYEVDFDHCEFKDSSYVTESENSNSDYQLAGMMVGSSIGFFHTPVEKEEIIQSVLFFKNPLIANGNRLFQTFYMDMTNLKFHVLNGHVSLLIDK